MIDAIRQRIEPILVRVKEQISDPSRFGKKKTLAYGGLLAVSLVLFLMFGGSRKYPDAPPEIGAVGSIGSSEAGAPALPTASGRRAPEEIPVTWEVWGHDPFSTRRSAPVVQPEDPLPGLALSGISWRDGEGVVLIDDLILREGETVQGAEIVNILPGCVVLERGGHKVVLCMSGEG